MSDPLAPPSKRSADRHSSPSGRGNIYGLAQQSVWFPCAQIRYLHLFYLNFHFQEHILADLLHLLDPVGREGGIRHKHVTDALTRLTLRCGHITRFPVLHRLRENHVVITLGFQA